MLPISPGPDELPHHYPDNSKKSEDRAENEPRRQLARRNTPPVAKPNFAKGHRTDDQRRCLRARVSAGADDQRNEKGQHEGAGQLGLETTEDRRSHHLPKQQHREPSGALSDHREEADLRVWLVERSQSAEALHILSVLFDERIDHVVNGHYTEYPVIGVHHR